MALVHLSRFHIVGQRSEIEIQVSTHFLGPVTPLVVVIVVVVVIAVVVAVGTIEGFPLLGAFLACSIIYRHKCY